MNLEEAKTFVENTSWAKIHEGFDWERDVGDLVSPSMLVEMVDCLTGSSMHVHDAIEEVVADCLFTTGVEAMVESIVAACRDSVEQGIDLGRYQ